MFQANILIALFKQLPMQDVPVQAIVQIVFYKTPFFLNMTLPVGMALASSLAMSRLTRETELTAMRAAGVSILRVVLPIGFFGVLVSVLNFYIVERVMPRTERQANRLMAKTGATALGSDLRTNVTFNLKQYFVQIQHIARSRAGSLQLSGVLLVERPRPNEVWVYTAERGLYENGVWTLNDTIVRGMKGENLTVVKPRQNVVINERIDIDSMMSQTTMTEEKTLAQLERDIQEGRRLKRDTKKAEINYHTRFSVPAACLVFAFTGPVMAVSFARSGAFMGVLLSIILVLLYYNAYVISTEIFGRNGWMSPMMSAWLPNIVFLVLGLAFLRRAE
ncbi:MAG: hypothetical protein HONBIEJF_00700 [Fimbriimonadaceae bacterium]|nr:hypothetical protein [Fimbriimonadaceae bacterium]